MGLGGSSGCVEGSSVGLGGGSGCVEGSSVGLGGCIEGSSVPIP